MMGETTVEYWFPVLCDDAWLAEIRKDYPDDAILSDDELREEYASGSKYCVTWDHIGDAMADFEPLADAYLELLDTEDCLRLRIADLNNALAETHATAKPADG